LTFAPAPILAGQFLLLGLALPSVLPEVANIGIFIAAVLGLLLFARSDWRPLLANPAIFSPLLAGLMLVSACAMSARQITDISYVLIFAPLFLVAPVTKLLQRSPATASIEPVILLALVGSSRCLIPYFDGALFSLEWKEALWDRFYTAAPRRLRRSVEQYSIVKRA
jgi:hypothetical protein